MIIYRIENLRHRYGRRTVLHIDNLTIQRHKVVGLIGPNGSGKSTLLRLLAFVESPSEGRILYFDDTSGPASPDAPRFQVTLLGQDPYLLKRTVFANVSYGLRIRKETRDLKNRVQTALRWVGLNPDRFLKRRWFELSGGEAQRVALAARLVLRPKVLLLDEPTANVDVESAQRIREATLRAQKEWGTTVVISSHDQTWLFEVCDTMIHLFNGRLIGFGMENILIGPWERGTDGRWKKRLNDGQVLWVSPPPDPLATALLQPAHLELETASSFESGQSAGGVRCRLQGVLLRLFLERATNHVLATVAVGQLTLTAQVPPLLLASQSLYPGRKVALSFSLEKITWFRSNPSETGEPL